MGILDKGAGIAAAVAAVKARKQLNRQASPLAAGMAATLGYPRGGAQASRAEPKPHEAGATRPAGQRV